MRCMYRIYYIIIFLIFSNLYSQDLWKVYKSDSIPINYLYCLDIDNNDNIWMGGESYVAKFDGSEFESFYPPPGEIVAIRYYNYNKILIGSDGNFFLLDNNNFYYPHSNHIGPRTIVVDKNKSIFIGSSSGLFVYEDTSLLKINDNPSFPLVVTDKGKLYSAVVDSGMNYFAELQDSIWIRYPYEISGWTQSMYLDKYNNIWFCNGSFPDKLIKYTGDAFTEFDLPGHLNFPSCIVRDSLDNIWIGWDGGLTKFDGENWFTFDSTNSPVKNNIGDSWVIDIVVDRNNTKWLATYGAGLIAYNENRIPTNIQKIKNPTPNQFSLRQNYPQRQTCF